MTGPALALRQAATRAPAQPVTLQRSCACETTDESCPRCAGRQQPAVQRLAHGAAPRGLPGAVGDVLRGAGQPLPAATRARMEEGFGHDFAGVRIHADAAALRSAAAINARAYTVGQHVVLGRSAPDLATSAGHRLLGHELSHVVQQAGGGVGEGIDPDPALEREAESAGAAIASGRAASVRSHAAIGIQRDAEEEKSHHPTMEWVTAKIARLLGFSDTTSRIVAASVEGGMTGFSHQWNEGKTGEHLGKHFREFSVLRDTGDLIEGYLVGAVEGIASPLTDLFAIGVMVEQLNSFINNLASSALSRAAELAQDLRGVVDALAGAFEPVKQFFKGLAAKGREGLKMLIDMFNGGGGGLIDRAVNFARSQSRKLGADVASSFETPWPDQQKTQPQQPGEQTAGWLEKASNAVGGVRDSFIDSPWSKVGNKAGYAVGFALIQVLMLVFSEGIGNLILRGGKALAGLAEAGTMLGKTIESAAKFATTAGGIIAKIEEGVNAAVSLLMKPLMPVLEPLMKPIAAVLERLGGFLRKLLGIAEKDAAALATTAAAKTLGAAHPAPPAHIPAPGASHVPPGHVPPAHVPPAHVPPPGASHAPPGQVPHADVHPPVKTQAHPPAPARDTPAGHLPDQHPAAPPQAHTGRGEQPHALHPGSDAAHKPLADPVPVGGGHHTQMTPDGFELCSPAPCPNLKLAYHEQLAANPRLKGELDDLDALREFIAQREAAGVRDPALAKNASEKAARLQQKLEAAAQGQPVPMFPHLQAPVGPPPTQTVPPLQAGPYSSGKGAVAGHHVHQSGSMSPKGIISAKGNPNHSKGIAIKQGVPGFTEAQHDMASATQRNVNRAMHGKPHQPTIGDVHITATGSGTGVTPSLDFEDLKAFYALRAAGRSPEEALELVLRSRQQIEAAGTSVIRVPSR